MGSSLIPGSDVLVVDDEADIRFLLAVVLEFAGFRVTEAAHGLAALAEMRRSLPRLVITDRMMPVMGGPELIARMRADPATASVPIVMLTANPGAEPSADAVLAKPFDNDELVDLVKTLIAAEG